MEWLRAVGVACGRVLVVPVVTSLLWLGCSADLQRSCKDCAQTLTDTGGGGAASTLGRAAATPSTGGTEIVDAGGSTGGVPSATGGDTSLAGGSIATSPERCSLVDGLTAESLVAQGALLLDVRTAEEYAAGHAQDAVNIPVEELSARIGELPAGRAIVVYCRSGDRSS